MSLKNNLKIVTAIMSLLSVSVFLLISLISISASKSEWQSHTSLVQNFKHYVSNMIKDHSMKIKLLLNKIQTNAQSVLEKIDTIKQDTNKKKSKFFGIFKKRSGHESDQLEAPIMKTSLGTIDATESRSFNHYQPTSYGSTGNGNYGLPTYHHHSIGFDPINIMVSVSLLSFLLQALQGLLTRTRLPTPVVEAKSLNAVEDWTKTFEDKLGNDKYYIKKKYLKKYY